MADCKECIHYNVCVIRTYPNIFEGTQWDKKPCNYFANTADLAPRAEVVKIIEEVKKKAEAYFWHHDSVATSWFIEFCDELKKKYTEGE